jgi:hypothetical protein
MEFCEINERHLLVWGVTEASVMVLNNACDTVDRVIELNFELESDEADYLIKCMWLPHSETMVAVICRLFVKIFDIRQAATSSVNFSLSYALAYEALIRDASLVSPGKREIPSGAQKSVSETVKLFLLLDSGQLLELHLDFDEIGQLEEQGELYIKAGQGMSLPIGGVRVNPAGEPASEGATMRSMGEPSGLTFLPESGVLLYSCLSSPVLALLLDDSEGISGSFEFLPFVVNSDVLGTGEDGYSIQGPFTHFTEIGCVEYDKAKFFRVVCVGKSSQTSQPKLLCLDFNDDVVYVKEVKWRASIPGASLTSSFDGLAAFSAPILTSDVDADTTLKRVDFMERAYLCVVASNGAMVIFGEEIVDDGTAMTQKGHAKKSAPSFPLTLFEKLVNVSDSEKLVFTGERIGRYAHVDFVHRMKVPSCSSLLLLIFKCRRKGCSQDEALP